MAEEVGTAFVSILPSMKGFSSRLKRELAGELRGIDPIVGAAGARAGHTFGNSMSTAIGTSIGRVGQMLKTGLVIGAAAAVAGLGALTFAGLKSAASLEQTTIGIEALLGSAEEAKSFIEELQAFAAKTPFEFQGVADASRRILAFGTSVGIAREQVIPTLTTIGDLVSVLGGSQENIDSVVRALGQMASKGKVSQEEVLQLAEALPGFNANAAIAASLGLSVADTLELITAGGVDARTGINALLEGMANFQGASGAMAKQAETLNGVLSTFKDTVAIQLTNAFQPVIPEIKNALKDLTPIIGAAVGTLAPALGQFLVKLLPLIATFVEVLAPILGIFTELAGTLLTALAPALKPLGEAFQKLLVAVSPLVVVLGDVLGQAILAMVPAFLELIPAIEELVPPLTDLLISLLPLIPPLAQLAVVLVKLLVPIAAFTAKLLDLFNAHFDIGPIIAALGFLTKGLGGLFKLDDINWGVFWSKVTQPAKDAANNILGFFTGLGGRLADAARSVGAAAVQLGRDIINGIVNGIRSTIGNIGSTLTSGLGNALAGAKRFLGISSPSKVFAEVGKDTVAGYVQGVEGMAAQASLALTSTIDPGAARSPAAAPRQTVDVRSSDPLIQMAIEHIRDVVRTTYGGNVDFALGTS